MKDQKSSTINKCFRALQVNPYNKKTITLINPGFTLLELITVLAALGTLTAIAAGSFQNIFEDLENDEVQAHLNSAGNDCLKALGNLKSPTKYDSKNITLDHLSSNPDKTKNKDFPYLIDSIDDNLLAKNGYKINSNFKSCAYFQIDPIDSNSNTHPSIGFGIHNNKLTKFGISADSDQKKSARNACERWAGDKCVEQEKESYDKFFIYMNNTKYRREMCELNFRKKIAAEPNIGKWKRWDASTDQACNNTNPVPNSNEQYRQSCKWNKCNKTAYVHDGKFVGYTEQSKKDAQSTACSSNVARYINQEMKIDGSTYDGNAVEGVNIPSCTSPVNICRGSQINDPDDFKECEIDEQVAACKIHLNLIRKGEIKPIKNGDGSSTVGKGAGAGGSDLRGLPPCGQNVWIKDEVVHYEDPDK